MISLRTSILVASFIFCICSARAQSAFTTACAEDTHIKAAKRQLINSVATDFLAKLLGANPSSAYEMLSAEGKAKVTSEQLLAQAAVIVQQFEPRSLAIQHTYLIELNGKSPGRVICATDLTKPYGFCPLIARDEWGIRLLWRCANNSDTGGYETLPQPLKPFHTESLMQA